MGLAGAERAERRLGGGDRRVGNVVLVVRIARELVDEFGELEDG